MVRHVDGLNQGLAPCKPFELLNDGDLLHLVQVMLDKREPGLTEAPKVKCYATGEMVISGQVRVLDEVGNDETGDAADFGRRRRRVLVWGLLTLGAILLGYVTFGTCLCQVCIGSLLLSPGCCE